MLFDALGIGGRYISIIMANPGAISRRQTNKLCEVSDRIIWNATSASPATDLATQALCADSCLTQTVVLNAPSGDNLDELREMCDGIRIEDYPFIEAMLFANLIVDDNGKVVAAPRLGTNATVQGGPRGETEVSGGVDRRGGLELQLVLVVIAWLASGFLFFPGLGLVF